MGPRRDFSVQQGCQGLGRRDFASQRGVLTRKHKVEPRAAHCNRITPASQRAAVRGAVDSFGESARDRKPGRAEKFRKENLLRLPPGHPLRKDAEERGLI